MSNTCVLVLGMHRSGTSCLAGVLSGAGVHFGNVSRQNRYNLQGNIEDPGIIRLHDAVLESNGGTWDNPPPQIVWPTHLIETMEEIIRTKKAHPIWGFKDPRTILFLESWLSRLEKPYPIATVRHPEYVTKSLIHRNGFSEEKCFEIYSSYNKIILERYKNDPFPILSFDHPDGEYREKIRALLTSLRLPQIEKGLEFFNPELNHYRHSPSMDIPDAVFSLYQDLLSCSLESLQNL